MSKFIVGTIVNTLIAMAVFMAYNVAMGYVGSYLVGIAIQLELSEPTFNYLTIVGLMGCVGAVTTIFGIGRESQTSKE